MKSYTEYLWFNTPKRQEFVNINEQYNKSGELWSELIKAMGEAEENANQKRGASCDEIGVNQPILLDYSGVFNGYISDNDRNTRTVSSDFSGINGFSAAHAHKNINLFLADDFLHWIGQP